MVAGRARVRAERAQQRPSFDRRRLHRHAASPRGGPPYPCARYRAAAEAELEAARARSAELEQSLEQSTAELSTLRQILVQYESKKEARDASKALFPSTSTITSMLVCCSRCRLCQRLFRRQRQRTP